MTPEERVGLAFINAPDSVLARDAILGACCIDEAKAHFAEVIRAAIAEEREACAQIAEEAADSQDGCHCCGNMAATIAEAIRGARP